MPKPAEDLSIPAAPAADHLSLEEWQRLERRLIWIYLGNPNIPAGHSGNAGACLAWWIQSGGVLFHGPGKSLRVAAGQWVFLPDGISRRTFDPDSRLLSIKFRLHWLDGRPLLAPPKPMIAAAADVAPLSSAGQSLLEQTGRILGRADRRIPERSADLLSHLHLDQAFSAWLAAYSQALLRLGLTPQPWGAFDDRLSRAATLMAQWNWRQEFTLSALARQVGLSPSRLSHLFTDRFGVSLMRYAALRRAARAQYLLESTDHPIKTIAFDMGFTQPSHFSGWFHRLVGQSPADYRQNVRESDNA